MDGTRVPSTFVTSLDNMVLYALSSSCGGIFGARLRLNISTALCVASLP